MPGSIPARGIKRNSPQERDRIMRTPMNSVSFDGIPPVAVRDALKAHGFRWNRGAQAWQSYQSIESAAVCDYFRGGFEGFDAGELSEMVSIAGMEADCGII